ncbi:serine/threonine protein kinase [Nocardia stercoris]|uniref:non-specific serine/threonine protein kinase n=2 Tax=Nocardia stercoris TaxID=2483361 RepID=A0A3M2L856_9NOCA|nr:serine/threonine protein kinase [Nocardia stercoris]
MNARAIGRGELVGSRFKLERPIGKGGMAQVWRATDIQEERAVAVKFLRSADEVLVHVDTVFQEGDLETLRNRFRREAGLLATLSHPGIPELYDHGSHYGTPFLAMRYIDGIPLNEFLQRYRPLPLAPAAAIAVQIASALECAHQRPVVHRDLKPQNVMISVTGVAVLIDFGIARPLWPDVTRYTEHGSSLGSPGYQAPEQIRGDAVVPKTDSYALGCVCYELFTARTPFLEQDGGLPGQHLDKDPAPLWTIAAQVPDELNELVMAMLAKSPEQRPDMAQIQQVLRRYLPLPGSQPPRPRLDPDPTLPYRAPAEGTDSERITPLAPALPKPAARTWLRARDVEQECAAAERELAAGEPGSATNRLVDIAAAARREWGPTRLLVRRVWQLAAEGLRVLGDCGRAVTFYQQMSDDLERNRDPADQAAAMIYKLRIAECRLPFGDGNFAIETLADIATRIPTLPASAAHDVRAVWSELETNLDELGYKSPVQKMPRPSQEG